MADPRFAIDWQPPDITQGVSLLLAARKAKQDAAIAKQQAATQAQYAENAKLENQMRRESADMARQKFAEEKARQERQDAIENASQLLPTSPLMRAAARTRSPELANALGKPYGITFDQGFEGPDVNPGTGGFQPPTAQPHPVAAAPDAEPASLPPYEGPDIQRNGEYQPPTQPPPFEPAAATAPAPTPPPAPEAPVVASPITAARRMYGNFNGQRFEVPEQQQETGLGGKYQGIYEHAVSLGLPEEKAFQVALTAKEKDDSQQALADRLNTSIAGRRDLKDEFSMNVDEQFEKQRRALEQSDKNSRRSAAARVASSGAGTTPPGVAELVAMKEGGASDSEIAAAAARLGVPQKLWAPLVKETGKTEEKHNQLAVTDPITGGVIGEAHSPQDKKKVDDANLAFEQLKERTQALIDDVRQNGDRINPLNVAATQRRESLAAAAAAAGRTYHQLGVSNANIELEKQILGPSGTLGHGLITGANADVIENTLKEAEKKHANGIRIRLRSGTPGDTVNPTLRPKKPGGSAKPPPIVLQQARAALKDPDAPPEVKKKAKQVLQQAGE